MEVGIGDLVVLHVDTTSEMEVGTADAAQTTRDIGVQSNGAETKTTRDMGVQCNISCTSCTKKEKDLDEKHVKELLLEKGCSAVQIKQMFNSGEGIKRYPDYTDEEICRGLVIRSLGEKTFCYLRNLQIFPLPSQTTLKRWISGFKVTPGLNQQLFKLLETFLQTKEERSRYAAVAFDEMEVKQVIEYDKASKCVRGPHKKIQVVMIRGLIAKWKQVIYFSFDTPMRKDLLLDLIKKCEAAGAKVQGVVFDLGNHGFLKEFQILSDGQNRIQNPVDQNRDIFFFADAPHMLKLLRNHLLDKGFTLTSKGSSVNLTKGDFEQLLLLNGNELKLVPKLSHSHVDVKGIGRQRVRPAAQLLSDSVAKAFTYHFGESYTIRSSFVKLINDWFDIMNSRSVNDVCPTKNAFGLKIESQLNILNSMDNAMETLRFSNQQAKITKLPFQKGIQISIRSLIGLFQQLQKLDTGIKFVMTVRLN